MKKSIIATVILAALSSSTAFAMDYESNAYTDQRIEVTNKFVEKRVSEESSATLAAANKYTDQRVEVSNKYTDKRAVEEGKAAEANANAYTDQRIEVSNKYTDKRVGEAEALIAGNSERIDDNAKAIEVMGDNVNGAIEQGVNNGNAIAKNQQAIAGNSSSIKDLQADSELHELAINANSGAIGQNQQDIETNKNAIVKTQKDAKDYTDKKSGEAVVTSKNYTDKKSGETLAASKNYTNGQVGAERDARIEGDRQTLQSANSYTNQKFSELGKRVDKVRKEANAGTASALAASQIPQVETNGRFALGAGVGGYNSQTAVAVGFSARVNDRTVTKFAVTTDTQHNVGFGAGVAVSW